MSANCQTRLGKKPLDPVLLVVLPVAYRHPTVELPVGEEDRARNVLDERHVIGEIVEPSLLRFLQRPE